MFSLFCIPRARLRRSFDFRGNGIFLDDFLNGYIWHQTVLQKEEHLRISLRKIITFHLKQRPSPFHILKWTSNNVKFCVKSFCHWLCLNSGGVTPGKSNVVYKWSGSVVFRAVQKYIVPGGDPGFFLRGGALVSCSTSTPINHTVFFGQNTSCIRKPQVISGGGVRTPCTLPWVRTFWKPKENVFSKTTMF